jgi:hypothetical protein
MKSVLVDQVLGLDCFSRIGELQALLLKEGCQIQKVRTIDQEGL